MKICVVSHAYVEQANLPILTAMAAQPGVELALITPARYMLDLQSSNGQFSRAADTYKTYPVNIRFGTRQGAFRYHRAAFEEALDDFGPDLILHEQEVFALGALQVARVASRRGVPLIMQVAENLPRSLILPRRRIRDYVLRKSAGLICWSEGAAAVHRDWGFRRPLAVIPGMANAVIQADPHLGRRSSGGLEVCFAGRLIASKGIDCLLRALAILRDRGMAVRCRIAGHGPERAALEALSLKLGLVEQVRFLGVLQQPDFLAILRSSDVLVLPSRRTAVWEEQFGRVLPQAMNEGVVTVGTRTGAIPDVIGRDDLLFEEDKAEQLATILERLAMEPGPFDEIQQWLIDRSARLFSNDHLAARKVRYCLECLESVAAGTANGK